MQEKHRIQNFIITFALGNNEMPYKTKHSSFRT